MSQAADTVTRQAREAGPMRQCEDLRGTTGFLDWAAEPTVDIDDIKDDANRAHDQAGAAYHRAKTVGGARPGTRARRHWTPPTRPSPTSKAVTSWTPRA
ncbi:hypothetical protein JCM4814A_81120 [Streptomyces phaeofaciens JCM 4814]|uniref:Uncharacterized protein n=1 Tax=Streptomyces phaeofaciens TaxID=68254 RepID=A0A918M1Y2_9ACTN|nr:hypothetical protein GCM10010226_90660 [Streptomyces phaeofaciens]